MLRADDEVAEPRPRRDADDEIVLARRNLLLLQLLVALDAGLRLRVAPRGIRLYPLELVLEQLLPGLLYLRLAREHRLLLLQPLLVVALVGVADAVVELEDPLGDVGEEVAVVRHDDERPPELLQVRLEAESRLRVEVVRRLVEEKDVGVREEKPRDRDAAALAAREDADLLRPVWAAEVGHAALHEVLEVPVVVRVDDRLEPLHLRGGLGVVELAAEVLVASHHGLRVRNALHNRFEDGLRVVELRLLREIADLRPLRDLHRAHEVGVETREDLEERRLARAVRADDADVRAVEEREVDVLQDRLRADLLRDVDQAELVFACHKKSKG